jgi:hypothetical protein
MIFKLNIWKLAGLTPVDVCMLHILDMLSHIITIVCTLQTYVIQLLTEVMFLTVKKFDFLIHPVFDCICCSLLVLGKSS